MALPPFATLAEYEAEIGGSTARTAADLDAVSARIRNYCHWDIWPRATAQQLVLDGPGKAILPLPTRRLLGIVSVTETQVGPNQVAATVNPDTLEWSTNGFVWKDNHEPWTCRARGIAITIDHGFVDVPPDLRSLTMDLAARVSSNPLALQRMQVGQISQDFAASGRGMLSDELALLNTSYRRMV